jgi:hypothetical protein
MDGGVKLWVHMYTGLGNIFHFTANNPLVQYMLQIWRISKQADRACAEAGGRRK